MLRRPCPDVVGECKLCGTAAHALMVAMATSPSLGSRVTKDLAWPSSRPCSPAADAILYALYNTAYPQDAPARSRRLCNLQNLNSLTSETNNGTAIGANSGPSTATLCSCGWGARSTSARHGVSRPGYTHKVKQADAVGVEECSIGPLDGIPGEVEQVLLAEGSRA